MVRILSDSTCDLSQELIKKYQITILPLHILLGEKDLRDGVDIAPDEIYEWADANNTTPKTAAPSPEEAAEAIKPLLEGGNEVICFSISESMSASFSVLNMAGCLLDAEDRVFAFDSANLSTGIGLLVLEAAGMAQEGKSAKEILSRLVELRPLVCSSFVVDTLTYLHRGGRCSGLAALAGGMLKLHPKIVVTDGKMEPTKKYRGRLSHVVLEYVKDMEEKLKKARKERVFITHSGCDQSIIDSVKEYLVGLNCFDEIIITRAGGVISSHCGPGTLGVLFIA